VDDRAWPAAVKPYGVLIELFVDQRITADEFETIFLPLYTSDPTSWNSETYDLLDRLFSEVDRYCDDPRLRNETGGIDSAELRERAAETAVRLRQLES
jgi:hypothetical protein